MTIVAGFDVHRRQITVDALDTDTGELTRGRIDATPSAVERWAARFEDREVQVALEACTGWLFVSQALERAGAVAHLAEPVETSALRGRKRRAKTDREDARWAAHAACRETAAGILDPAGARPAVALAGAAAKDADRRAHAVAGARPGDALSPRHRWRPRRAAQRRRTRVPRRARAARRRARADRDRAGDDRLTRRSAASAGVRAASARAAADRLPCADGAVRHGRADLADDAHRAGRRKSAFQPRARPCAWPGSTSACIAPIGAHAWASSTARAHRTCAGRYTRPPCRRLARGAPTMRTISH